MNYIWLQPQSTDTPSIKLYLVLHTFPRHVGGCCAFSDKSLCDWCLSVPLKQQALRSLHCSHIQYSLYDWHSIVSSYCAATRQQAFFVITDSFNLCCTSGISDNILRNFPNTHNLNLIEMATVSLEKKKIIQWHMTILRRKFQKLCTSPLKIVWSDPQNH